MKLFLMPLATLNALWNTFIVAFVILVLCTGYCSYLLLEKAMSLYEWIKVLAFRSITYSGMCLINLMCAIGFCAPEMMRKKDSEKSDHDQKDA